MKLKYKLSKVLEGSAEKNRVERDLSEENGNALQKDEEPNKFDGTSLSQPNPFPSLD